MREVPRRLAFVYDGGQMRALALALVLVLVGCSGNGHDALESMIEIKLEMRAAVDEIKRASVALGEARGELDRARGDLDRSRRVLQRAAREDPLDGSPLPLRRTVDPELAAGITCVEAGVCMVQRSVFDLIAAEPASLVTQARIVPSAREGANGLKIYGIRPGSLFQLLGAKNGDLITSANGKSMLSVDDLRQVFAGLRSAKKLELVGERKGEPLTLTLTITDDDPRSRR